MADWGGIARAVEEGLLDDASMGSRSSRSGRSGARGLAEALTGSNFAGFKMRDIFDKDRWTRRERVNQGRRFEETGIPDYTYDYNPTDRGVTTGLGPDNSPVGVPITGEINQAIQENAPWQEGSTIDQAILDKLRREPAWTDRPSQSMGIQDRNIRGIPRERTNRGIAGGRQFGAGTQMDMSGVTGYLPGRMSVGEARRARAMRNMSIRDRQEAGFGEGMYDDSQRRARSHDMRHGRLMNRLNEGSLRAQRAIRLADLALGDTTGTPGMGGHPSENIGSPNWAAIEEDMARQAMRDEFIGRDDR